MIPEDTSKIIAAIDRNTEAIDSVRDWLFIALMLIVFFFAVGIKLHATPLLPPLDQPIVEIGTPPLPPPNPHLQYWHTQWVPGPDGVLPLEVFAPGLRAVMARGAVDAVDVPEPETIPAMVGLLCVLVVIFALWRKR